VPSGIKEERDLANKLHQYGFAVIRSPASGGATKMPRPDIIAGSKKRRKWFAFEVKTTRLKSIHISKDSFHQLIDFSEIFGCYAVFALKFKQQNKFWLFIKPVDLIPSKKGNYNISLKEALLKGMDFSELIGEGQQTKLS
jgi:Holliday junction resolvase